MRTSSLLEGHPDYSTTTAHKRCGTYQHIIQQGQGSQGHQHNTVLHVSPTGFNLIKGDHVICFYKLLQIGPLVWRRVFHRHVPNRSVEMVTFTGETVWGPAQRGTDLQLISHVRYPEGLPLSSA